MDIQEKLYEYSKDCEEIRQIEFKDFSELETKYCDLINKGTWLRSFVLEHPEICSDNTIRVLNNETDDISLIEDKYKALLNILYLKKELLGKYEEYVKKLCEEKKYDIALLVYNRMFKFSQNYEYLLQSAILNYEELNRRIEACMILWEIEPYMQNNPLFYWKKARIYEDIRKYYHSLLCKKKAIDLETNNA